MQSNEQGEKNTHNNLKPRLQLSHSFKSKRLYYQQPKRKKKKNQIKQSTFVTRKKHTSPASCLSWDVQVTHFSEKGKNRWVTQTIYTHGKDFSLKGKQLKEDPKSERIKKKNP